MPISQDPTIVDGCYELTNNTPSTTVYIAYDSTKQHYGFGANSDGTGTFYRNGVKMKFTPGSTSSCSYTLQPCTGVTITSISSSSSKPLPTGVTITPQPPPPAAATSWIIEGMTESTCKEVCYFVINNSDDPKIVITPGG
jgi:hypothetical protein